MRPGLLMGLGLLAACAPPEAPREEKPSPSYSSAPSSKGGSSQPIEIGAGPRGARREPPLEPASPEPARPPAPSEPQARATAKGGMAPPPGWAAASLPPERAYAHRMSKPIEGGGEGRLEYGYLPQGKDWKWKLYGTSVDPSDPSSLEESVRAFARGKGIRDAVVETRGRMKVGAREGPAVVTNLALSQGPSTGILHVFVLSGERLLVVRFQAPAEHYPRLMPEVRQWLSKFQ